MSITLGYECLFGRDTTMPPSYVSGWSRPEDGFTWATGNISEIDIPRPAPAESYILEIWASPSIHPEIRPTQLVVAVVNDVEIGRMIANDHTVFAFQFPGGLVKDAMRVRFIFPDALDASVFGKSDNRRLGFSFVRLRLFAASEKDRWCSAPVPEGDTMLSFESIGDNCEFGIAQRRSGVEPLGLLRFSGQPIRSLIRAIDDRFQQFGDASALEVVTPAGSKEQAIFVRPYHMHYHTFISTDEMTASEVIAKQRIRLKFLAGKFLEDVSTGCKVFVLKRNARLDDAEILPVFVALNRIGPATVLAVRPSDVFRPEGYVGAIRPGILCGYIKKFGSYGDPHVQSLEAWQTICKRALAVISCEGVPQPDTMSDRELSDEYFARIYDQSDAGRVLAIGTEMARRSNGRGI